MPRQELDQASSAGVKATVAASAAALGVGSDGDIGIVRVGTWPNLHEQVLRYSVSASKWIGDPTVLITQSDGWAMDLGNKSGTALLDWGLITNVIPYGKSFTTTNTSQAANSASIGVAAVQGHLNQFTASGTILIRDNIITYTGVSGAQTAAFSFTGCTLVSGSGGTIPSSVDVVQGYPGGFGMVASPLSFVTEMWAAGFRLQEKLTALMNGEAGSGTRAMTVAPYWYEYNNGDGYAAPVDPPTGTGIGFSASLVGPTTTGGAKSSERSFSWVENAWATWSAGSPTKRFMLPRLYGKMASGAIDTGEILDAKLSVRWTS